MTRRLALLAALLLAPAAHAQTVLAYGGALGPGDDTLGSGEFADPYSIIVPRGTTALLVSMTSEAFDTYVLVRGPNGENADNDDAARSRNAASYVENPAPGVWRVTATSARAGEAGPYQIVLGAGDADALIDRIAALGPDDFAEAAGPAPAAAPCSGPQPLPNGAVNLGTCVNSVYHDVVPLVSPDGRTLYFVRRNSPDNTGGETDGSDIWVSALGSDGQWGRAAGIGAPLNTAGSNFVSTVLPDGNTLLLGNTYNPDGTMSGGISLSRRTASGWSFPEALRIPGLVNRSPYSSYAMAGDGRTLLMAVQGDDSLGDLDLYASFVQPDGSWSAPLNLGPTLNTAQTEGTPFLAADGTTLYFSSAGHGGLGSYDVFVTHRLDDSWTRWSTPENLGPTVNTAGGELGFNIPASGDLAYLASNEQSVGGSDIVRVAVPQSARPRAVALVSGRVLDAATGAPLGASVTYEALDGSARGTANTDPTTGAYTIALPAGAVYGFRGEAARYYAESTSLDLTATTAYEERTQDLRLTPLAVGATLRLNNLFFDTGRATLRPESAAELDRLVAFLAANLAVEVEIAGHTDSEGLDATNRTLSQNRAQAVVDYLTAHGVAAARTTAQGYGEARPSATNDTAEGRQANRRVEFRVTSL